MKIYDTSSPVHVSNMIWKHFCASLVVEQAILNIVGLFE